MITFRVKILFSTVLMEFPVFHFVPVACCLHLLLLLRRTIVRLADFIPCQLLRDAGELGTVGKKY